MDKLSAKAEAIKLSRVWQQVCGDDFPIRASELAREWSRSVAPEEPIGSVLAQDLPGFEAGLFWLKTKREWTVLYRAHEGLPGRSNFTIAHELGHYVLHRRQRDLFQCSQEATLGAGALIEREADEFASFLLMPIPDFKNQVRSSPITLDLLGHCADRYQVSLTAAALKWLSFTEESAIIVVAREGMVLWWRASDSARRTAFAHFHSGKELPPEALAVSGNKLASATDFRSGVEHDAGVWVPGRAVREMTVVSDRYDLSISVLMLEQQLGAIHEDEPDADLTTGLPTI